MFVGLKKKCIFAVKYKCYKAMNGNKIIGREQEQRVLASICEEEEARLVAVYGRRRVGKTYLVKNYFKGNFPVFVNGTPKSFEAVFFDQVIDGLLVFIHLHDGRPLPPGLWKRIC